MTFLVNEQSEIRLLDKSPASGKEAGLSCVFNLQIAYKERRLSWENPFFLVSVLDKRVFPRLGFKKPPVRADPFALPMPVVSEVRGAAIWTSRESALRPDQNT